MTIFGKPIKIEYSRTSAWGLDAHVSTVGVNMEASYANLNRLLAKAVRQEWPGARVEVGLGAGNNYTIDGERFSADGIRLIEIVREVLLNVTGWMVLK